MLKFLSTFTLENITLLRITLDYQQQGDLQLLLFYPQACIITCSGQKYNTLKYERCSVMQLLYSNDGPR